MSDTMVGECYQCGFKTNISVNTGLCEDCKLKGVDNGHR